MWGRRWCLVIALVVAGCSGGHSSASDDPLAAARAAADRSLISRATFDGRMTAEGQALIELRGAVDFSRLQSVVTVTDARAPEAFVPFEERFIDNWSYLEISPSVKRPPTVAPGTRWIAFQGGETNPILPIPDRAMPPAVPIDALRFLSRLPVADARFLQPRDDGLTRVEVRYRDAAHRGPYTYTIGSDGRVAQVTVDGKQDQDLTLDFEYIERQPAISEPVDGVQRLEHGEQLYPAPSTTSPAA
jgi:hypothetical protein